MFIKFLPSTSVDRPQATVATAYSLRPKPGAPVSTPLHWEEVKKGLRITDFNLRNVPQRLKREGDIFKGVIGKGINMPKAIKRIESLFGEVLKRKAAKCT